MKLRLLLSLLVCALCALAQIVPAAPPPATPSGWASIIDPTNLALATYSLSQIADSTTDWNFSVRGKVYNVSPARRTAFAGGTLAGAFALAHYFPKSKKIVTAGLVVGTAILAGRAYAHTLVRTPVAAPVTPAGTPQGLRVR
jgi:hypothetical protein